MNYIGVDCHISSLDFAVVNEMGAMTKKAKVNTGVKEFISFVKSVPKPRIKNKIKASFRKNGIRCSGVTVYSDKYRAKWREQLSENKTTRLIVEELWVQLDQLRASKERLKKNIRIQSKQYPEIKQFMQIPGIGLIHAVTLSAIIETPHRFANKKKLWMYAGVGLMERRSGEKVYSRKLTREYNRPLKNTIKQAVEASIHAHDNQFRRQYLRLTLEKGLASHKAKLTVARSMLATLYGMWKKDEAYDPEIDIKRNSVDKT